ncbi:MAG: DUF2330 domain-containing protein [Deltaproteobacteria bacterium]|nr:DUF2330 domain-containing protein [Deltaproteobacteria bacterium]
MSARAAGLVFPKGQSAEITDRTLLVASPGDDGQEVWIEELWIEGKAQSIGWLMPVPSAPIEIRGASSEALIELSQATELENPQHISMRPLLFGPSLITAYGALSRRAAAPPAELEESAAPAEEEGAPSPARISFEKQSFVEFSGETTTSTITGAKILPAGLEAWLEREQLFLPYTQREAVARYLDDGWTIVATVLVPPAEKVLALGPVAIRFRSPVPVDPQGLTSMLPASQRRFRLYTASPAPLVPELPGIFWDSRPWMAEEREGTQLRATFSGPASPELGLLLSGTVGERMDDAWVVRGEVARIDSWGSDLRFARSDAVPAIPGRHRRDGWIDLFLCVLLGMMPIFYTPEAWLFMWLGYNARADRKPRQPLPFRAHLWALYGLVVSFYWLIALEGAGRIAALGPIAFALGRLLISEEGQRGPVRIDFQRRKKRPSAGPARASQGAPRGSQGPPRGSQGAPPAPAPKSAPPPKP